MEIQMPENTSKSQVLDVFKYHSSMHYVRDFIQVKGHGYKSAMARAMACQSAYVSRVLKDQASFSLEQAERLTRLFSHSHLESKYFLTMVARDRAGTPELRNFFESALRELHDLRTQRNEALPDQSRA
jgi:hypothetical protein